jgi:sulfhydrogenase subunit beta (sulfur reductase)
MKRLAKKDLLDVLKGWTKTCTVMCPTIKPQGDALFDTFDAATFTLDYGKPPNPPKSFFLPHSEVIFEVIDGRYEERTKVDKTLLFGIRACDMTGLAQARSFMNRDKTDPYYQARLDATLTVVMACAGPQNATCFCTTTRSGPCASGGFDLQFYDLGESFLVEIGSERGAELAAVPVFVEADEAQASGQVAEFWHKAVDAIPAVTDIHDAIARLAEGADCSPVWERFGAKCIVCGGCAFVCPTCTCFNVYDQASDKDSGVRIKAWDACLYGGFTREASSHNPRPTQAARLQRRHEHKLLYYNATDIQAALCGCVGCGRCSDYCPVHIGTLEVAQAIVQKKDNSTGGDHDRE